MGSASSMTRSCARACEGMCRSTTMNACTRLLGIDRQLSMSTESRRTDVSTKLREDPEPALARMTRSSLLISVLDDFSGDPMRVTTAMRLYWAAAVLCLGDPLIPAQVEGITFTRIIPFVFWAAPLSAASLALGFAHWQHQTRSCRDVLVAGLWLAAVVSLTLPVAVWAFSIPVLVHIQAALVGAAAAALLVTSLKTVRDTGTEEPHIPIFFRALSAGGILLLALLFARGVLRTYAALFTTEGQGLAALAAEARLFSGVTLAATAAIAIATIASVLEEESIKHA
jgi:hypothetical protein